jgi:glucokinase
MKDQFLLAGDIGGTKTLMALFSNEKGPLKPVAEQSYASGSYADLDSIIGDFLQQTDISISHACFGVAGPVVSGRAKITKLPWQLVESELQAKHGFASLQLVNDLVATGYGLSFLENKDLFTLNEGNKEKTGAIGIIAPGTGLGEAIFGWAGSEYIAIPSEGGHTDFAPTNNVEMELLRFLLDRYDHVSYDRLCSGRGIPEIYDFFKASGKFAEPAWLADKLAAAEDKAPLIINTALDGQLECSLCQATLDTFVSILGAEAGNLALMGLTTGGIYLGGGIPALILQGLPKELFMTSFTGKGRMSYLLNNIPVKIILNPKAALIGAAAKGLQNFKKQDKQNS